MPKLKLFFLFIFILCSTYKAQNTSPYEAKKLINKESLAKHIKILGSDKFLGRGPGHEGEERTINYIESEFKKMGLKPANNGSYIQSMTLAELTPKTSSEIIVAGKNGAVNLKDEEDYVAITRRVTDKIKVEPTEIIFAGYGINAPEYNWNDFNGIDVKNKIIIVMVNDPGYATGDANLFNGKAMTYYGRWTYKYEEGARQGAAGIFVIHETGAASYPWAVVRNGRIGPQYFIEDNNKNMSRCKFEGWITFEKAEEIFNLAGLDLKDELALAAKPGFKAKSLHLKTSLEIDNKVEHITTRNVMGIIPGTERPDEYIFYTAHWDHLGFDPTIKGDNIFNGARDNASGVAGILEIADAFTKVKPKRSIAILSVAGEEQGLIGSEYYVQNPLVPLNKTVAVINLDAMNIFGKTKDVSITGFGQSELDNYVIEEAKILGKTVKPDPHPESGGYFRSDHFNFAKVGVPAIYLGMGTESVDGKKNISQLARDWNMKHYHKVTDEYNSSWDLSGMVEDVQMLFDIGYKLSGETTFPKWNEKSEFHR